MVVESRLFHVARFSVVGALAGQEERILEVLRPQVIASRVGGFLGADNFFSWNDSLLYEDIRSSRVSVEKNLFAREVIVHVHPRQRYGVWCFTHEVEPTECSWIDASGVAFEQAPIPQGQLVTAIYEQSSSTGIVLGAPIMKLGHFEVVKRVAESLAVLNLPVSEIRIDRSLEEVRLFTLAGPRISFSLRFDPTASALPALKKLISTPGISGMRTIDFTVENRVFYTLQ